MIPKFVDEQTKTFRLSQCDSCEQKSSLGICKACNCIIKAKVRFTAALCPLHKWGEEGPLPTEQELEAIRQSSNL
jgi:hypothetical protein